MSESAPRLDQRTGLLGWIIRHRWLTMFLCCVVLLVLTVLLLDMAANNRLQRRLNAIRAAGEPVTIEDLAARMPQIPDEENLFIALTACVEGTPATPATLNPDIDASKLLIFGTATPPSLGRRLSPEQRIAVERYLELIASELVCLHKALELDKGCMPIEFARPAIATTLPNLTLYRQASKIVALEATLAREQGDFDTALHCLEELVHMDRAMASADLLICALVRMGAQSLARDQIGQTVNLNEMSDDTLHKLQAILGKPEYAVDLKRAMMGERVFFTDTLDWMRRYGPGAVTTGGPELIPSGWSYVPIIPELDEAKGLSLWNGVITALGEPNPETLRRVRATAGQAANLPWHCVFSKILMPSVSRGVELWIGCEAETRALQVAIACERYRLQHGGFPDGLQALVPEYLDAIPLDPFDGKPLRYKQIDKGIVVYSIGEDETDDGGDVGRLQPRNPQSGKRPPDLGWVILRPELRGLPAETPEKPAG